MVAVSKTDMFATLPELAVRRKPGFQIQRCAGVDRVLSRGRVGFQQGLEAGWDRLGQNVLQRVGRRLAKGGGQGQPVREKRRPGCPEGEGVGQTSTSPSSRPGGRTEGPAPGPASCLPDHLPEGPPH